MTAVGIAFGIALTLMAGVQGFVTLTIGFVAIRLFGQGALMLTSTVAVTLWFEKRRGTVFGAFSTGTSILMALVPVGLSLVIGGFGWRVAWLVAAFVIWMVVVPIARFGLIDRPSDVGQIPDGPIPKRTRTPKEQTDTDSTRQQALRTKRFWILLSSTATVGMLSTALNFHQISLLTDAGLTTTEAALMFLPQVIGAGAAGLLFGFLSDRLTGRWLIPMTMALLATSLLAAANLTAGVPVVLYAVSLGAAGGAARSVSATLLPRWFGVRHIGEIQGIASFVAIASTALGPVAFAVARSATGGYGGAATWFVLLPLIAGMAATTIRPIPSTKKPAS
jgi:MFS family permease